MKKHADPNLIWMFMVACSLFGWFIVLLMMVFPPATMQDVFWRKPLVGSILFLISTGGSLAAVSPRACSIAHRSQIVERSKSSDVKTDSVSSKGHHPDCGRFSNHTIQFRGNSYCAACTGLLIGGVVAMIVTVLYFFVGVNAEAFGLPAFALGQFGPALGLLQFKFKKWVRLIANMLFVLGSCLILVGVDKLVHNVFVDVYVIGVILVWILTRVMISQRENYETCRTCGFSCGKEDKVGVSASSG